MKKTARLLVLLAALVMVLCLALTACGEQDITYVLNGGTNPASAPAQYKEGEALDLSAVKPTRTGYTFDGWYLDSAFKTKASITEETEDPITVYAKWTPNVYAIKYVLNGGENVADAPTEYTYAEGKDLSAVVPTKEHYNFAGWYLDADFATAAVINETTIEDVTLYAKWTPVDYDLNVELNGGEISSIPSKYTYSVGLNLADFAPSRTHYVFEGWFTDAEFTTAITEITATDSGAIAIYAKWSLYDYKISYEYGAGEDDVAHDGAIGSYNFGTAITVEQLGAPTRDGYVFAGWFTDADFTTAAAGITAEMGEDITFYAKWTPIFNISYDLDGARLSNKIEIGVVGTEIDLSALVPTKRGYDFKGWYTDADFTTAITAIPATQTEDITLYAKLEKAVYTITYVLPEGVTVPEDAPKTYTYGEGANVLKLLPVPTGEKLEFAGWFADEALTIAAESALTVQSAQDISLYPKMTPVSYAINYTLNTADVGVELPEGAATRYYYGTGLAELPVPVITSKGYIFKGWFADDAFTTPVTSIAADSEVDVTVYAKYSFVVLDNNGEDLPGWGQFNNGTITNKKAGSLAESRTDENGKKYIYLNEGTADPQFDFGTNLDDTLKSVNENAISVKVTLALDPETETCAAGSWRLRYYTVKYSSNEKYASTNGFYASQGNALSVFTTSSDGQVRLNGQAALTLATLTTEPQTFYFVVDFSDGKIKAYNEYGIKIMETDPLSVSAFDYADIDNKKVVNKTIPLTEGRYLFNKNATATYPLTGNCTIFSPYFSGKKSGMLRMYNLYIESGNVWEKPEVPHNITWNGLEGADPIELPETYIEGLGIAELPAPTKTRAEFKGWYTTPDFQEGTLVTSIPVDATADYVLYAKFEGWTGKGEGQGYLEYETFGGTLANPVEYEVYTEGTEYALQDATLAGYAFGGWYTDRTFAPWSYVGNKLPTTLKGDVVVYANWIKVYKETAITGEEAAWEVPVEGDINAPSNSYGPLGIQAKDGASVTAAKDEQGNAYLLLKPSNDPTRASWSRDGNIFINGAYSEFGTEQYVITFSVTLAKEADTPVIPMKGRMRTKGVSGKSNEVTLFSINDKGEFSLGSSSVNANFRVPEFDLTEEFKTINIVVNFETATMYAVNADGAVLMARPMTDNGGYIDADFDGSLVNFLNNILSNNVNLFSICTMDPPKVTTGEGESAVVTSEAALKIKHASITAGNSIIAKDTVKFGTIVYNGLEDATQNIFNNTVYTEGYGAKLFDPAKENYVFAGWYADADFTTPISAIGADATGEQNVYAKWVLVKEYINISGETYPDLNVVHPGTDANNMIGDINFQTIGAGTSYKTETTEEGTKYIVWTKGQPNTQLNYEQNGKLSNLTEGNKVMTYQFSFAKNGEDAITSFSARLRSEKIGGSRYDFLLFTVLATGEVAFADEAKTTICTIGDEFVSFGIVLDFEAGKIYAYDAAGVLVAEMAMTFHSNYADSVAFYNAIEIPLSLYAGASSPSSVRIGYITATTSNLYA